MSLGDDDSQPVDLVASDSPTHISLEALFRGATLRHDIKEKSR